MDADRKEGTPYGQFAVSVIANVMTLCIVRASFLKLFSFGSEISYAFLHRRPYVQGQAVL